MRTFYDRYWGSATDAKPEGDPLTPRKVRDIEQLLAQTPGARVVDGGCGAGTLTLGYAHAAGEVHALDVSDTAIARAGRRAIEGGAQNVRFERADLEARWPVADGWADLVVTSEVVEHVYDFPAYFDELARITKPGGRVYLTTPYHGLLKNIALAVAGFDKHFCNFEGGHIRFFTDGHLTRLLKARGFAEARFHHLGRIAPLAMSTVAVATRR